MSRMLRHWILGLATLLVFAGAIPPPPAQAQVIVRVGPHRRYHRRYYRRHRPYHRYDRRHHRGYYR